MKRSIPIGLLVVSLVALFVLGGTLAWFTADAEAPNMFTTGTVHIEIDEDLDDHPNDWAPGIIKKKEVSVKNVGSLPVFVRVQLTPVWGSMDGEDFREDEELSIENVIFNINTDSWVKSGDWYYYMGVLETEGKPKGVLEPEGKTPPLLYSVTLDGTLTDNDYQGKTLKIYVNAEAVQAAPIEAALEAWGLDELPF